MGVSKNRGGPPKSSILIGFSIINHPFWGTPIFGNTHILICTARMFCFGSCYIHVWSLKVRVTPGCGVL